MYMIKRMKVEFNFTNVEAKVKRVDANTTDIYFISTVNAKQLFNLLKDGEGFDGYNDVCVKDAHTISIIGEVDVRYNKDTKLLTIVSFS